jgi:NAD-dependent oxidoreductase involved in siderophore biosynthesis
VGIAVLGTGGIVRRSFVPAVRNTAAAKLVAVLSRDKQRARAFADEFGIPGAYDDLGALLADPGVHAVVAERSLHGRDRGFRARHPHGRGAPGRARRRPPERAYPRAGVDDMTPGWLALRS